MTVFNSYVSLPEGSYNELGPHPVWFLQQHFDGHGPSQDWIPTWE